MSNRRIAPTQSEYERALSAAKNTGFAVVRYEIDRRSGKCMVIFVKDSSEDRPVEDGLANWLAKNNARPS